ncbi:hypothetical protein [Microbacterium ulmi]|uniref:Uncharacterized protein n=1 Tax=Microbacterium ulmi TaxID=179095 RepID=A0A7Y2Q0N1_9MICO|nr:hypothetical protein [Microbacterium ulmi]NII68421.1 hypothetical protein [Microbacterium ulmi]NNH03055.1 hypothetical protein [Microbacterium ulmi]
MSNYPVTAPLPPDRDDPAVDTAEIATQDLDGVRVLDPDADDDLIDSAEADRIAAGANDED